ncbi:hypothetical protein [Clostridium intestinale]|uniref:Uncharacterized protein n=1 Tax=Clostridium intestinale DSM 6191 TaxID=1121320 RepID=A0A1M6AMM9_9CLOT|nr:hypothetical protein [Clostridium intestinale]SHI37722.1 hypothetical protein SAMN02745941_03707 [Clostridium intestinale DSM 6191]
MRVRVYDKKTNTYFKSEVYAIINSGYYEKLLILTPSNIGDYLMFYDYLDKTEKELPTLINKILPNRPHEWITIRSNSVDEQLNKYKPLLTDDIKFFEYIGFPWIWEDTDTLIKLLHGERISLKGSIFENNLYSEIIQTKWNYVETQEDADIFMELACDLHDSVIKEINYISGAYVDSNKAMYPLDDLRRVTVKIQSQQCSDLEMVFEGVTALNIRPALDNYFSDISGTSLIVKDASLFFCDDCLDVIDTLYNGTWILAYSLKWRFVSNNI